MNILLPRPSLYLVVFNGPPCSGKSPLSKYIAEEGGYTLILDFPGEYIQACGMMRRERDALLERGRNVVLDVGAPRHYDRKRWLYVPKRTVSRIRNAGKDLKRCIIRLHADREELHRRYWEKYGTEPHLQDYWLDQRYEDVRRTLEDPLFHDALLLEYDTTKLGDTDEGRNEFEKIASDIRNNLGF
ncbi:MAG: ATP-binding protein [Candidatus Micrarchaeota archaeon]|nr:ATP-binding protein [Candidatus Micrarchaeota archaeon]